MGNTSSDPASGVIAAFYAKHGANPMAGKLIDGETRKLLCELLGVPEAKSGGAEGMTGGSCVGGYDALQDYGNSMFSKAKEKLIRDIAEEVFGALKSPGVRNARTAPIGDVVSNLSKLIPPSAHKARKFGKDFNKSSESQRKVCHALANALNKSYGGSIIDMSADENDMCNKVAEVMYSLFTGLHTEFMSVAGDAMRVMNNMQSVMRYIDAAYKRQREYVNSSGDARLREQSSNTDRVYQTIKSEYDRQMAVLANLMNVTVGPTGKSLISSLEDNRDFSGLVKDIRAQVGTSAFGDKLSYLLSGVSSVAHSAEMIDRALKKIGMSVSEFKDAKNAGDLRIKVMQTIMKEAPSSKRLDEMMKAAELIYNNNYNHDAVSKALSGKKGGGDSDDDVNGGGDSDDDVNVNGGALGGADDDEELGAYWSKKSLSKKITNKKKYRNLVLNDFRKVLRAHFQTIVSNANQISMHIGNTIPVTDELNQFVRAFGDLDTLDEEKMHIALSGYPKDSLSREKRERFMNNYHLVINVIEPLTKGPDGQLFKALGHALVQMVKAIDDFSDKMVKALTEIHIDSPAEIAAELKRTSSAFYGSGDGGDSVFGSGTWVAFDKVKQEMKYYLTIANIKTNIARSADDLKSYSDDYEQILGEEAGWMINRINSEFRVLIEQTEPQSANFSSLSDAVTSISEKNKSSDGVPVDRSILKLAGHVKYHLTKYHVANRGQMPNTNLTRAEIAHKNLVKLWTVQLDAKIKVIKVAQAVDLYLKAFTNGISRNPDSVSSVVKMLDQVELVAKWFNDRSGDNLANLFDVCPNGYDGEEAKFLNGTGSVVSEKGDIKIPGGNEHYYTYVEKHWNDGKDGAAAGADANNINLPGNPFLGRPLEGATTTEAQLGGILNMSTRVVKSMRALENILSAFASVGSKFGDLDPAAHTFMNPGQMFEALCSYVSASAFTSQFAATSDDLTAAVYHSVVTEQKIEHGAGAGNAYSQTIPSDTPGNKRQFVAVTADKGDATGLTWSHNLGDSQNQVINQPPVPNYSAVDITEMGILTGVANTAKNNDPYALLNKHASLAFAAIPTDSEDFHSNFWQYHDHSKRDTRLDVAGWRDNNYDTDLLFTMTIKSIVAKVFTVVDAYRLFNRPTTDYSTHYSLNPLRTILGGADGGVDGGAVLNKAKVMPEVLELYLRLPLLAEWYRETYGFKGEKELDTNAWRLSLVPSIDGVWSGFVNVIFDKASYVKEGNYSETQVNTLITEINNIWKLYKSKYPNATTRNIINAFVLEMNRMFGFIKQREIDAYLDDRKSYMDGTGADEKESFLDYDILNANDQFGSRPAPSDKFTNASSSVKAKKDRTMVPLLQIIERIRKKMDTDFTNQLNSDGNATFTFIDTLRNYKNEMLNAKNDTDSYNVVLRMVQGVSKNIKLGSEKLIMIHETVAAPLAVLYGVYKVLARYNALLHGCSLVNLGKWNKMRASGGSGDGALATNTNVLNEYLKALSKLYPHRTQLGSPKLDPADPDKCDYLQLALFAKMLAGHDAPNNVDNTNCGYLLAAVAGAKGSQIPAAAIKGPMLYQDILAAILDLCTDPNKLITCSVGAAGHINVDYSALEDLSISLLEQVKVNIKKLRQLFPPNHTLIIDKYEDSTTVGSTRWLEENLVEVLFKNRDESGLPVAHADHLQKTLAELNKEGGAAGGAGNIGEDGCKYGSMDPALQGLVFYQNHAAVASLPIGDIGAATYGYHVHCDFSKFPFNVIPKKKEPNTEDEKKMVVALSATKSSAGPNLPVNDINSLTLAPIIYFETDESINTFGLDRNNAYKSLMTSFNKLLRMYLYTNLEEGTVKFYAPLIEAFAHTSASVEIIQGKAFPDVAEMADPAAATNTNKYVAVAGTTHLLPPPAETIVYASNALAIRGILTTIISIGTTQKKRHLYENLAEVPEYLKERMKVNLPFFSKMLQNMTDRANLLKSIINNTNLKDNIADAIHTAAAAVSPRTLSGGGVDAVPGVCTPCKARSAGTSNSVIYYNGLLSKLVELSTSLRKCADGVYKELQDKVPYFLETSKDFLADYRQNVGGLPLMPSSSLMAPLLCLEDDIDAAKESGGIWQTNSSSHLMIPVKENGSAVYKYNYATRLILARSDVEVQLDHIPGAKEIYNSYASTANKQGLLSPAEYSDTIKSFVKLTKFLADGAVYGRQFDRPSRSYTRKANKYASRNVFSAVAWNNDSLVEAVNGAAGTDDTAKLAIRRGSFIYKASGQKAAAVAYQNAHINDPAVGPAAESEDAKKERLKRSLAVYALMREVKGVVELTENTNTRASRDSLAKSLGADVGSTSNDERKKLQIQNILEYNIVPINVHAFMREVPFVNLLNYSYTFDRMVHDFVLPTYITTNRSNFQAAGAATYNNLTVDNIMIKSNANVSSTRELMVKLLVHPYAHLGSRGNEGQQYFAMLASLFNGNDNLKLGRPRYLSDQLWHKALLTSSAQLVASQQHYNREANNNIPSDYSSPELGLAGFEAQRAMTRYGAPKQNEARDFNSLTFDGAKLYLDAVLPYAGPSILNGAGAAAAVPFGFKSNGVAVSDAEAKAASNKLLERPPNTPLDASLGAAADAIVDNLGYALTDPTTPDALGTRMQTAIDRFVGVTMANLNARRAGAALKTLIDADDTKETDPHAYNMQYADNHVAQAKTHIDTMWARAIAGIAADTDYNEAKSMAAINRVRAGTAVDYATAAQKVTRNMIALFAPHYAAAVAAVAADAAGGDIANNLASTVNAANQQYPLQAPDITLSVQKNPDLQTIKGKIEKLKAIMHNPATAYADSTVGPTGITSVNTTPGFIAAWEKAQSLEDLLKEDLPGKFSLSAAELGGANVNRLRNGPYRILSLYITLYPHLSDKVRKLLKYCSAVALADLSNAQVLPLLENLKSEFVAGVVSLKDRFTYNNVMLIANAKASAHGAVKAAAAAGAHGGMTIVFESVLLNASSPLDKYLRMIELARKSNTSMANRKNAQFIINADPVATRGLKVWKKSNNNDPATWTVANTTANALQMLAGDVVYCAELGRMRFDTKLVRNLTWFVQLQRVMRVVLTNHLSWINTPVVRGLKIADPKITEYNSNDVFEESDFNGSSYNIM